MQQYREIFIARRKKQAMEHEERVINALVEK